MENKHNEKQKSGRNYEWLLSGMGWSILQGIWSFLYSKIDILKNYWIHGVTIITFMTIILVSFLIYRKDRVICELEQDKKLLDEKINLLNNTSENESEQFQSMQDILERVQSQLDTQEYECDRYRNLNEFYKQIATSLLLKNIINESVVTSLLNKIEDIVKDNINIKNIKINVSLFKLNGRSKAYIYKSLYHTIGKIKSLRLNKNSFVGHIFQGKEMYFIEDVDNLKREDYFQDVRESNVKTIWGIPYICNEECLFVMIITADQPRILNSCVENYTDLLKRYSQIIGIILLINNLQEG